MFGKQQNVPQNKLLIMLFSLFAAIMLAWNVENSRVNASMSQPEIEQESSPVAKVISGNEAPQCFVSIPNWCNLSASGFACNRETVKVKHEGLAFAVIMGSKMPGLVTFRKWDKDYVFVQCVGL